jgi:membrane-associated phospholipid phosphatase
LRRVTDDQRTLAHPWCVAVVAAVALGGAWIVAVQRPVGSWELSTTTWFNDAPNWVAHALWPVMQVGTLLGPIVVALLVLALRRDWFLALAIAITGLFTWWATKIVKHVVGRGRPRVYLPDINVRNGSGLGFGFFSGHSSVAACTAVMAMAAIPRRWHPLLVVLFVLVGVARIVYGMHLPADVVGGWAFGTLVALLGLTAVDRYRLRHPQP